MMSKRLQIAAVVAGAVLVSGAARAADYSQPPPVIIQQPQPECCDGWYLRGQVGVGMTHGSAAEYLRNPANNNDFTIEYTSYSDAMFIGGGVGYEVNNWLRIDATAEYRAKSRISAYGTYTDGGGGVFGDIYEGNLSSWILLANAYVDLGTWNCFTPFVGAGIGGSYNMMSDFIDTNQTLSGRGYGRNSSEWNFAWALYAGVAYEVTKNFKVELSYRYLNYGSITETVDCVGGCAPDSYKFGDLYSHDIMLGFRWTFCCDTPPPQPRYVVAPAPVYTQPQTYAPPPVYAPPPLRSKG